MKFLLTLFVIFTFAGTVFSQKTETHKITSPDSTQELTFLLSKGQPTFSLSYKKQIKMMASLGFEFRKPSLNTY
ncbi:MAG: hypothetical protein V2A54_10530, partial [Bacteroidota bacterium]